MVEIACPQCRHVFPEANARHIAHGLLCPRCQTVVSTHSRAAEQHRWYLARCKKISGPLTLEQIRKLLHDGELLGSDRVWHRGMSGWVRLADVPQLQSLTGPAPASLKETVECDLHDGDNLTPRQAAADTLEDELFLAGGLYVGRGRFVSEFAEPRLGTSALHLDDFHIINKLGSGGMGTVYLAERKADRRHVALKVLTESLADSPVHVSRFCQEAAILAELEHPNLVQFLGAGQDDDVYFFAMDYIRGVSAARILKKLGKLPVADALYVIAQCAQGLDYAACRQVIHRDLKPDNILISRGGQIRITDFGLAKSLEQNFDLTESGLTLGTPRYMPPEQYLDAKNADLRSDIYALGGVLYHFLTGTFPFAGTSAMELMLHKEHGYFDSPRRRNSEVPPRLDLIVGKMLARDPKHRYQNYRDLLHDLHGLGMICARLGFDVSDTLPNDVADQQGELEHLEVLFVDVSVAELILAQRALEQKQISSSFNIVGDGHEALAFLNREADFAKAPRPHLIVLGGNLHADGTVAFLEQLKSSPSFHAVPLVVLAQPEDALAFLSAKGFRATLVVHHFPDPEKMETVLRSAQGLCLTIVEAEL